MPRQLGATCRAARRRGRLHDLLEVLRLLPLVVEVQTGRLLHLLLLACRRRTFARLLRHRHLEGEDTRERNARRDIRHDEREGRTCILTFSRNLFVISTSLLNISFLSSRPRLLGLSKGSGFKFPSTIDTFMLSGINAFVVSASRFNRIFSRSSVSGFDGSIRLSARVGLLPQNDVSSRHLCGLGDLAAASRVTLA